MSGSRSKRYGPHILWPTVAIFYGVVVPTFLGLAEFTIGWLMVLCLLAVFAITLFPIWLILVVVKSHRQSWGQLFSTLIAPVVGYAVSAGLSLTQPGLQARLLFNQFQLQREIAHLQQFRGHRHVLDDWGDAGSALEGPLRLYTLIYDEDGTVANEAALKVKYGENGPFTLRHIRGHFYLMTQFP